MFKNEKKALISEFLRYIVVGGLSFVTDFCIFTLLRETVYKGRDDAWAVSVSTAIGFAFGFAVNYLMSMWMVFKTDRQRSQGKGWRAVSVIFTVAFIGFWLTMLLQWLGEKILGGAMGGLGKYAVKAVVAGIVLVWNYAGRKIFVFKERGEENR